jgi:hypothetical protein
VEQAHLGQVFMCHHGGGRYGFEGCRRTYLSQRDLQAHHVIIQCTRQGFNDINNSSFDYR